MGNLMKETMSGLIWKFAERCGAQGVSFIVSIILARLLSPDDYGTIALVTVIIELMRVFVDSGLGTALIQKKDADDIDFSTVFYVNLAICILLYAGMFLAAPLIAGFYGRPDLVPVIRVLGLTLIISGIKNVQQAFVSKNMLFKRFFFSTLGGTFGGAIIGIGMAYLGFGVWALVFQQLFQAFADTLILWMTVKWRPKRTFSFKRLKSLFSFGWKLLISSLISTIYSNIRPLIIGKVYSSADLAYFNKGSQFPYIVVTNINSSIDSVLLPVMSKHQDDRENVMSMTRRAITISSYVMWPLMIGMFTVAEPLIRLMLTEKWLGCVPFLQIYCLTYGLEPIQTANLNAIKAMGRSDLIMKLEITKKTLGILILVIAIPHGVLAIGASVLVYTVLASVINAFPNRKLLGYSYGQQIRDIIPSLLLAVVMGIVISPIALLPIGDFLIVFLQVCSGAIVYILLSKLLHFESYKYIMGYVMAILKKKSKNV